MERERGADVTGEEAGRLTVVAVAFRARYMGEGATVETIARPSSHSAGVRSDDRGCSNGGDGSASFDDDGTQREIRREWVRESRASVI
ncbi:glycine dehydrogenase [Sesbania bispinosa]|nr:glycine dehydrogenase [Sesbania bispinosa]